MIIFFRYDFTAIFVKNWFVAFPQIYAENRPVIGTWLMREGGGGLVGLGERYCDIYDKKHVGIFYHYSINPHKESYSPPPPPHARPIPHLTDSNAQCPLQASSL